MTLPGTIRTILRLLLHVMYCGGVDNVYETVDASVPLKITEVDIVSADPLPCFKA